MDEKGSGWVPVVKVTRNFSNNVSCRNVFRDRTSLRFLCVQSEVLGGRGCRFEVSWVFFFFFFGSIKHKPSTVVKERSNLYLTRKTTTNKMFQNSLPWKQWGGNMVYGKFCSLEKQGPYTGFWISGPDQFWHYYFPPERNHLWLCNVSMLLKFSYVVVFFSAFLIGCCI